MKGTPWTASELTRLRELAPQGAGIAAATLGRSEVSVRSQASRYGVSLRLEGERRGRILYAPDSRDGLEVIGRIRADAAAGLIDVARMERLVELVRAGVPTCRCGSRPIENPRIGICRVCYLRDLRRAHELELEVRQEEKAIDAVRARKHRAKRAVA